MSSVPAEVQWQVEGTDQFLLGEPRSFGLHPGDGSVFRQPTAQFRLIFSERQPAAANDAQAESA